MATARFDRMKSICLRARELEGAAREAYLERECAADSELVREIRRLLESDTTTEDMIDQTCQDLLGMQASDALKELSDEDDVEPLAAGFDLEEVLGSGAFGTVFAARDRTLGRRVALKILHDKSGESADSRNRFLAEARTLASIEHENVVKVHSIDEENGAIRLVMEWIDGKTLTEEGHERGPSSAEEAASVGVALCRALAALHGKGLVHRDVKPSNVMRAAGGRIVLLDFGLATTAGAAATEGRIAGTPVTMAPEQITAPETISARTDVYALGVVLYWMVTGVYPHSGATPEELLKQVEHGRTEPLADARPDLPAAFSGVVTKAMATNPEDRYESAGAMLEALVAFQGASTATSRKSMLLLVSVLVLAIVATPLVLEKLRSEPAPSAALALVRASDGMDVKLGSGTDVRSGDFLELTVASTEALYVYVFNEDESGAKYLIFPLAGTTLHNPLPPGEHRLPGRDRITKKLLQWPIFRQPEREEAIERFTVFASRNQIPEMNELISQVEPIEVADQAELNAQLAREGLRGVSQATAQTVLPRTSSTEESPIDVLYRELRDDPDRGVLVQRTTHDVAD